MFGIKFIKIQPTTYLLQYRRGHVVRESGPNLRFTVREPFPTRNTGASLVFGKVTASRPLVLISQMAENGVIFSDGIEKDFIEFNSGTKAVVTVAERKGILVV